MIFRGFFALQAHLGGLAIPNPTVSACLEYSSSIKLTAPLVSYILLHCMDHPHSTSVDQKQSRQQSIHWDNSKLLSSELMRFKAILPPTHVRSMELNIVEKGPLSLGFQSCQSVIMRGSALHMVRSMIPYAFVTIGTRHTYQAIPTKPHLPSHCGNSFTMHWSCTHLLDMWFSTCSP